jgi:hypothetical protein
MYCVLLTSWLFYLANRMKAKNVENPPLRTAAIKTVAFYTHKFQFTTRWLNVQMRGDIRQPDMASCFMSGSFPQPLLSFLVLRYFLESQVSELQITERYFAELQNFEQTFCRTNKLPYRYIVELISYRTILLSNIQQNVEPTKFRTFY